MSVCMHALALWFISSVGKCEGAGLCMECGRCERVLHRSRGGELELSIERQRAQGVSDEYFQAGFKHAT